MRKKSILSIVCYIVLFVSASCAGFKASDANFILKHDERVVATSFCQAEDKLATITSDGTITLWDINTGGIVGRINTNNNNLASSLVYTETNGIIVIYKNGDIVKYDPMNVAEPIKRVIPEDFAGKFVYYPEGRYFILGFENTTTTKSGNSGGALKVFTPDSTEYLEDTRIRTTEQFNRRLESIGFEYGQKKLNISLPTNSLRTVDSDREINTSSTGDPNIDMMNRMNKDMYDNDVEKWRRHYRLTSITISHDGIIACGFYSGLIILYDSKTNREIRRFEVEDSDQNTVTALAFNSDGRYLLSGSSNKIIRLWDAKKNWSKVAQSSLTTANSLCFSPNGNSFIAENNANSFFVVNAKNGKILHEIYGSKIKSVFYTKDNEIIVIGIDNQLVQIHRRNGV